VWEDPINHWFDEVTEDIPIYIEMSDGHNALGEHKST
jgi:hypothetical protein